MRGAEGGREAVTENDADQPLGSVLWFCFVEEHSRALIPTAVRDPPRCKCLWQDHNNIGDGPRGGHRDDTWVAGVLDTLATALDATQ